MPMLYNWRPYEAVVDSAQAYLNASGSLDHMPNRELIENRGAVVHLNREHAAAKADAP